MFKAVFPLLLVFLLANALVLQGAQLIDFGFCLFLCGIFVLLYWLTKSKNRAKKLVCYYLNSKHLLLVSWFFLSAAWVAGFSLWQLDHRLDLAFERESLWVEGQVKGLPDQEDNRQVFEFLAEKYWQCSEPEMFQCQKVSLNNKPLPPRLFSLAITEKLWFYFFRTDQLSAAMPKKIRVALYQFASQGELSVQAGERYQLLLKLRRPRSSLNFEGFDYETWLFTQGIHANAYVKKHKSNIALPLKNNFVADISRLRDGVRQKIITLSQQTRESKEQHVREVSQSASLILALTIGDRSFVSSDNKKLFVNTGTAHLLAISGMHIALMTSLAFFIVFNLARSFNWLIASIIQKQFIPAAIAIPTTKKYMVLLKTFKISPLQMAALCSLIFAIAYALLAGFSLPTQRALIMVLCYSLALVFYRRVNFYGLWCLTMLLVVIRDPFAVLSSGFYLSFIAVFFIQWVLLGYFTQANQGILNKVRIGFRAQLAVFIGLSPLSILFFSGFFPLALLCNIFAVPLVSLIILPVSLLLVALTFLNGDSVFTLEISQALLRANERLIDLLLETLVFTKNAFPQYLQISIEPIMALSLLCFIVVVLSPLPMRLRILALVFLLPITNKMINKQQIPLNEIRVQLLDVGQGLSLILETQHHLLLYDTGPSFGDNFDAGSAIVIPALLSSDFGLFKKPIDYLVLSHGDKDHIGGAKSILENYRVRNILAYRREFYANTEEHFPEYKQWMNCEAGQMWNWDGVTFQVLYPEKHSEIEKSGKSKITSKRKYRQSNNQSCVLLVQAQNFSILLPGDIEKHAERNFLEQNRDVKVDVLVAPHHGSKSSSEMDFLSQLTPSLVLVSAGFNNQFGHPHQDVMNRYDVIGAKVLVTAQTGALTINSWQFIKGNPVQNIRQARELRQQFWRFQ